MLVLEHYEGKKHAQIMSALVSAGAGVSPAPSNVDDDFSPMRFDDPDVV